MSKTSLYEEICSERREVNTSVLKQVEMVAQSDSTVLMRFFETSGNVRRAISVIKSRTTQHAQTIHELQLGHGGVRIGAPLVGFEGVLTGIPNYRGATPMMDPVPDAGQ